MGLALQNKVPAIVYALGQGRYSRKHKQGLPRGVFFAMLYNMHHYAALLGINPALSIAELSAVFPDFTQEHLFMPESLLTFATTQEIDQHTMNRLGGTLLIAERVTEEKLKLHDIPALLAQELAGAKGKVSFALRIIGVHRSEVRDLYRHCKKGLKQRGISSRYIGNENEPAKTIQLHDEGLMDPKKGCEIVMLKHKDTQWIGKTIAAQDVKAYTVRDMEKPVRDTTVGLLPPKLAQMLLHFGEYMYRECTSKAQSKNLLVLDPFCGTGVIPIEAMLRGHTVLASDISLKAVNGTEKNVDWVRKTFKILKKDLAVTIWKQDATKPFDLKEKPDVIVTEGTLGPALKSRATVKDAESYCKEAEELTASFLKNVSESLPGVPVVMILPVWYAQKRVIHLQKIWDRLQVLGFKPVLPPHTSPAVAGHFSLLYRRSDQFVGREIVLLQPITA